jgi:imidazole glycerol phosphate synthase subunit HisF
MVLCVGEAISYCLLSLTTTEMAIPVLASAGFGNPPAFADAFRLCQWTLELVP